MVVWGTPLNCCIYLIATSGEGDWSIGNSHSRKNEVKLPESWGSLGRKGTAHIHTHSLSKNTHPYSQCTSHPQRLTRTHTDTEGTRNTHHVQIERLIQVGLLQWLSWLKKKKQTKKKKSLMVLIDFIGKGRNYFKTVGRFFFQIVVKITHSNKCYKGKDHRSGRKITVEF